MSNNYRFFSWNGSIGKVFSKGVMFDFNEKPVFSFKYNVILYEPEAQNAFKLYNNIETDLTDKEIEEINIYSNEFFEKNDFPVYAYDPNDMNLYKGNILKSEAISKNYKFRVIEIPENLTASWDENKEQWKIYRYVIRDDGFLLKNVSTLDCKRCVLFFTEEEWKNHSHPVHDNDRWDFVTETWKDTRDIEELRKNVLLEIRNKFEVLRWRCNGNYIPQYEQSTWYTQINEAVNWKKDHNYLTPYIDTFLEYRTDKHIPTKEDLVEDIIKNNHSFIVETAKINALQWKWLKDAEDATSNEILDAIREALKDIR